MRRIGRFYLDTFVQAYTGYQSVVERVGFAATTALGALGALATKYEWAKTVVEYLALPPLVLFWAGVAALFVRLLYVNYERFRTQADLEAMKATLRAVAQARADGVQIFAKPVDTAEGFERWKQERRAWSDGVLTMLRVNYDDDAAIRFSNLGELPNTQYTHAAPLLHATQNAELYHQFTKELQIVSRLLQILSELTTELRTAIPFASRLSSSSSALTGVLQAEQQEGPSSRNRN